MKSGQSKITAKPLNRTSDAERLEKLDEWTEAPAKEVAASIAKPAESTAVAPKPEKKGKDTGYPWESVPATGASFLAAQKSVNFKIPMDLYLKLKWLGETTYLSDMTKIVTEALQEKTGKLLKERGIKP